MSAKKSDDISLERQAGIKAGCPACQEGRAHEPLWGTDGDGYSDWDFHPRVGTGNNVGVGGIGNA